MSCRIEIMQMGGAYPKSCPTCKFGPCQRVSALDPRMSKQFDYFAERVKLKLLWGQEKGREGWDDKVWAKEYAAKELIKHVTKGDPLDVAAFAFFLSYHNLSTWPENES